MKTCSTCEVEKEDSDFPFKNKAQNKLSPVCRSCQSLASKKHYQNNKQSYFDRSNESERKAREFMINYLKEHPCVDCGYSNILALDFHHLGNKRIGVGRAVANGSLKKLQEEIDKCVVLCANCHRIRTAKENDWSKLQHVGS